MTTSLPLSSWPSPNFMTMAFSMSLSSGLKAWSTHQDALPSTRHLNHTQSFQSLTHNWFLVTVMHPLFSRTSQYNMRRSTALPLVSRAGNGRISRTCWVSLMSVEMIRSKRGLGLLLDSSTEALRSWCILKFLSCYNVFRTGYNIFLSCCSEAIGTRRNEFERWRVKCVAVRVRLQANSCRRSTRPYPNQRLYSLCVPQDKRG